jgi:hypothetical protein
MTLLRNAVSWIKDECDPNKPESELRLFLLFNLLPLQERS